MLAKINKWGNSLALRLPASCVKELGLHEGEEVRLEVSAEGILVRPSRRKKYVLADLLAQAGHDGNEPERILKDGPRGEELL